MEITMNDYLQAREVVNAYEKELLNHNGIPCYILYNLDTGISIVIENKDFAERLLESNESFNEIKESRYYPNPEEKRRGGAITA